MGLLKEPTGEPSTMKTITTVATIGLDIAKNSFSVHGFDDAGITVPELRCQWIQLPHRGTEAMLDSGFRRNDGFGGVWRSGLGRA